MKLAPTMKPTEIILLNMCGRGDKVGGLSFVTPNLSTLRHLCQYCDAQDMSTVATALGFSLGEATAAAAAGSQ
jgi:hypothetical protein